jgi:hypothetical protein
MQTFKSLLRAAWPGTEPQWREAWRWGSMRVLALLALVSAVWEFAGPELLAFIPADYHNLVMLLAALAGMVLRLRKSPDDPPEPPPDAEWNTQ